MRLEELQFAKRNFREQFVNSLSEMLDISQDINIDDIIKIINVINLAIDLVKEKRVHVYEQIIGYINRNNGVSIAISEKANNILQKLQNQNIKNMQDNAAIQTFRENMQNIVVQQNNAVVINQQIQ